MTYFTPSGFCGKINDESSLLQAAFFGDESDTRLLVKTSDVNYQDCSLRTPLHAAAYSDEPIICELLVDAGANVNSACNKILTPLHFACLKNSTSTASFLIDKGADLSSRDEVGQTPLHCAAFSNASNCVQLLIDKGCDVNCVDKFSRTPLHNAAHAGYDQICELLIKKGALPEMTDKLGRFPIHLASFMGHVSTFRLLYNAHSKINPINFQDLDGFSPVLACACNNHASSLFDIIVIEYNPNYALSTKSKNSVLHLLAMADTKQCIKLIKNKGLNANSQNEDGFTPLHISAILTKRFSMLEWIPAPDVHILDNMGRTPLHYACLNGNTALTQFLLTAGADPCVKDINDSNCFHLAAQSGSLEVFQLLASHSPKNHEEGMLSRDGVGIPPHMIAALNGFADIMQFIHQECFESCGSPDLSADDRFLHCVDKFQRSMLHACAVSLNVDVLFIFLKILKASNHQHFSVDGHLAPSHMLFRDRDQLTALHYACAAGNLEGIRMLLNHYQEEVDRQCALSDSARSKSNIFDDLFYALDANGAMPVHYAVCADSHSRCANLLLSKGANFAVVDSNNFSPIHYAVISRNFDALHDFFLNNPAPSRTFAHLIESSSKTTPLHLAASRNMVEIVDTLVDLSVNQLFIIDHNDLTPLEVACRVGATQSVDLLVQLMRKHSKLPLSFSIRKSAFHLSVASGNCSTVRLCLDRWPDVLTDRLVFHAVAVSLKMSHIEIGRFLLSHERSCADLLTSTDSNGRSILHFLAVSHLNEDLDLLHSVCAKSCVVGVLAKCENLFLRTPLHLAAMAGSTSVVKLFAELCPDALEMKDVFGFTPLELSIHFQKVEVAALLLDLSQISFASFHCAILSGCLSTLEVLLSKCATNECLLEPSKSRNVFHSMAYFGCKVPLLDAAFNHWNACGNAEVDCYDSDGLTPFHYACMTGNLPIMKWFLRRIGGSCIVRPTHRTGKTFLHLLAENSHEGIALRFLTIVPCGLSSSFLDAVDSHNGETVVHICVRNGLFKLLQRLSGLGADCWMTDSLGNVPLLGVCKGNSRLENCLKLLLSRGHFAKLQNLTCLKVDEEGDGDDGEPVSSDEDSVKSDIVESEEPDQVACAVPSDNTKTFDMLDMCDGDEEDDDEVWKGPDDKPKDKPLCLLDSIDEADFL